MPGAWLAARALGLPIVASIRDVGPLCPFAVCVQQSDTVPADCDLLLKYVRCADLFYKQYVGSRSLTRRARFALNSVLLQRLDLTLRRFVLARTDKVVFISEGIRAVYLCAPHSRLPDNVVIYNVPPLPSEHATFSWEGRRRSTELLGHPIVLYVGKQSPGKGTPDLMAAIPKVIQEVPDARFLFVGRGDAENQVSPELGAHVIQWNPLPNPDILALMGDVQLVVLPSATPEAQGRVLLEAMSAGVPSVATRVGGIPETVVDGETGLLVDRHDVAGLARAIVHLLKDPQARQTMGQHGQELLLRRFDPARSLDQIEALYSELVSEYR
jgi:glycosyltransferase involved in cell wall biosynthesis